MSATVQVPEPLRVEAVEARILKDQVWDRMWRDNEHFMCVIVGREGSGKSYTGIKIAETVDPSFTADRVMFDPVNFLKHLREWKKENETQGKLVVIDEAGVGVGVRTWYNKDQVRLNQVLQIIRDENMGVIFTLPRLEELDSQTRGRLHAYLEMTEKQKDQWAMVKWLDWDPTRDGRNKIYREYPKLKIDGHMREVKRLCISPPSPDVIEGYEKRKSEFQAREYDAAIEEMQDDVDDEMSVKDVAIEIENGGLGNVVSAHSQTGEPYINKQLVRTEYDISFRDAEAVKALLDKKFESSELNQYV